MFQPTIIKNIFHEDIVYLIKKNVQYLKDSGELELDTTEFRRRSVHNDPFFVEIHHMITERFNKWTGLNTKPSYVYGSFYGDRGVCPPHVDRPQCKYTLDYCINQKEPWAIYVNSTDDVHQTTREKLKQNAKPYMLNENDGLILSGTQHWHYRDEINTGNYCDLLFFHFVDVDFQGSLK
jgi:hypothetical protein